LNPTRPGSYIEPQADEAITIELTKAQVDRVVLGASGGGVRSMLMSERASVRQLLEAASPEMENTRLSQSLILGLLMLACFPGDRVFLSTTELARRSGMGMSTTHRYITTLVVAGLLERDPATRLYRVAQLEGAVRPGRGTEAEQAFVDAVDGAAGQPMVIALSKTQVEYVVQEAAGMGAMSVLLSGRADIWGMLEVKPEQLDDSRVSRSLLTGLMMLAMFPLDGSYRGNAELARALAMNPSTTHRYLRTLAAVGLLEHDPATRRYRLPQSTHRPAR
jgi:DNA-binding IclR family transcriptional regulator